MLAWASDRSKRWVGSVVCEEGVSHERRGETFSAAPKMANERVYGILVEKNVLNQVNRYDEAATCFSHCNHARIHCSIDAFVFL